MQKHTLFTSVRTLLSWPHAASETAGRNQRNCHCRMVFTVSWSTRLVNSTWTTCLNLGGGLGTGGGGAGLGTAALHVPTAFCAHTEIQEFLAGYFDSDSTLCRVLLCRNECMMQYK
jgi:hypothetical protein